jgi:hypothetical protein
VILAIGLLAGAALEQHTRVFVALHAAAIPCSVFGVLYAMAAMHYDLADTRRSRFVLGVLAALLIAGTAVTFAAGDPSVVVYDSCSDPSVFDSWWWRLWCLVK